MEMYVGNVGNVRIADCINVRPIFFCSFIVFIFFSFFLNQCNNPQTKEPKLEQAKRIVPEWTDYDNEIKKVMEQWKSEQKGAKSPVPTVSPTQTKVHTEDL